MDHTPVSKGYDSLIARSAYIYVYRVGHLLDLITCWRFYNYTLAFRPRIVKIDHI